MNPDTLGLIIVGGAVAMLFGLSILLLIGDKNA